MKIKLLTPTATVPTRGTDEAAGYDLYADIDKPITVSPGVTVTVSTGIAIQIPTGFVGIIKPRSGLAFKCSIDTMAGVIDSDYTGEIKVLLTSHDDTFGVEFEYGARIAQLLIVPCHTPELELVDEFEDTERGDNGFGSTGK